MSLLKDAAWRMLQSFGVSVSINKKSAPSPLLHHNIDVLFDVGANVGQYSANARKEGFSKKIVSFEPLAAAYEALTANVVADECWIVHERCAVGASIGNAKINVSKNSYSSSLLPMLALHSDAAPESVYVGSESVKLITLDSVFTEYCKPSQRAFLKIDTQGSEGDVLAGANMSLEHIVGVQLEMSIAPLYESQFLYDHFFEFFKRQGFVLWSLEPGFFDQRTGQLLQFDGVFVRL